MTKLSDDEIRTALVDLPGWEHGDDLIAKEFGFPGFPDAVGFVVRLGMAAEKADHHPDLDVRYNKVRVALSTHSEGGVTEKDVALAKVAEKATSAS